MDRKQVHERLGAMDGVDTTMDHGDDFVVVPEDINVCEPLILQEDDLEIVAEGVSGNLVVAQDELRRTDW